MEGGDEIHGRRRGRRDRGQARRGLQFELNSGKLHGIQDFGDIFHQGLFSFKGVTL
jgi:hypothetical protein